MNFSLIVPLYNSSHIKLQIKSFCNLILDKINLEIIFIDDGSYKKFRKEYLNYFLILKRNSIIYKYIYIGEKKGRNRVCLARNTGVKKSKYDNLIFIDQDTVLHKNYFQYFKDKDFKSNTILGPYLGYNNKKKFLSRNDIDFFIKNGYINKDNFEDFRTQSYKRKQKYGKLWQFFAGSNFFIKKNIFNSIGGFDENIITWGDEDVDFGYRLQKLGYKIILIKEIIVLNISKKLYKEPYSIIENSNINSLTSNFLYNYNKNGKDREYKKYILERFMNFDYEKKVLSNNLFKNKILFHNFYNKNRRKIIFFKMDLVDVFDSKLKKNLKTFLVYNIPIILTIKPRFITTKMAKYLINLKLKFPELIDIILCKDKNFYNKISYIKKDISIMKNYFGPSLLKAFTYDFISCDNEIVLERLGINLISSCSSNENYLGYKNIISIPSLISLDITKYKKESFIYNKIDYYLNRDGFIGLNIDQKNISLHNYILLIKVIRYMKTLDISFLNFSAFYKKFKI